MGRTRHDCHAAEWFGCRRCNLHLKTTTHRHRILSADGLRLILPSGFVSLLPALVVLSLA